MGKSSERRVLVNYFYIYHYVKKYYDETYINFPACLFWNQ